MMMAVMMMIPRRDLILPVVVTNGLDLYQVTMTLIPVALVLATMLLF